MGSHLFFFFYTCVFKSYIFTVNNYTVSFAIYILQSNHMYLQRKIGHNNLCKQYIYTKLTIKIDFRLQKYCSVYMLRTLL